MEIAEIRLLLDGGMVVLIWMIQRIVYPSFQYYEAKNLVSWHRKYSGRLAAIVIPLMIGQLIISIIQLVNSLDLNSGIYALLIWFLWGITFAIFVPLHGKISNGSSTEHTLSTLEKRNWIRTITWTLLFLLSLFYFLNTEIK